jgi:hypothetical protein
MIWATFSTNNAEQEHGWPQWD